jgi:predicted 2-oxoglutarate/Fe(II)-dependent dioxygenase YbiX
MEITKPYGNEIIVVKNFSTPEETEITATYAKSFFFSRTKKDLSIYREDLKQEAMDILKRLEKRFQEVVVSECYLPVEPEFSTFQNYIMWENGSNMEPHYDNVREEHHKPVMYGCIWYVTDDFDGGELYYPEFDIKYKPVAGDLVIHPGTREYNHGINTVLGNPRITVASFCVRKDDLDNNFDYED